MKTFIYSVIVVCFGVTKVGAQINRAEYNAFDVRDNFEIYPNSTDDKVTFESDVDYKWEIVNQQGMTQMEGKSKSGKNPLEVYGLSPGTYYVRFVAEDGTTVRQLIVR